MTRLLKVAALLVLGAATVAALRWAVYAPLVCEGNATRAIAALEAAVDGSDAARRAGARRAEFYLQGCERFERTDFRIAYAHGIAYRYQDDTQRAIRAFRRALAVDRRPEIYLALGFAQLDAFDRPAAIDSFVAVGAFAPARLDDIPYDDVRTEVRRRIRAVYGKHWVP